MRLERWFYTIPLRLRSLFRRAQVEQELDDEFLFHLEQQSKENLARGMTETEARYLALRRMGGIAQQKERCRDMRRVNFIEDLGRDLRYALRVLAKSPAFTIGALLTLTLGIGVNTAIFSVVNQLLLRPLPYLDAERLVMVWETTPEGKHQNPTSPANFRAWREQSTTFEELAAFTDQRFNLTGTGAPEEVSVQLTTPELFKVLGVTPILGRTFTEEDNRPSSKVAVLGYGIWQRRFGGDPQATGKTIMLDGESYTVIGVMPSGFKWHLGKQSRTVNPPEIWTILNLPPQGIGRYIAVVARLKSGVSIEQAQAEVKTVAARREQEVPQYHKGYSAEVISLRQQFVGNVRPALLVLLAAVCVVTLISCANVASLLLARGTARAKEISVRTALGAHRLRVLRQLLTESLLLAAFGSVLGLGFAWLSIKMLIAISPRDLPSVAAVGINLEVLGWTLAVSLLTGVAFGLAPALEATRLNLSGTLKQAGQASVAQDRRSRRLRSGLVVAEIALAVVLLVGAGLLIKTFARLQKLDLGFVTDNVLTMVARLPNAKYQASEQKVTFFRQATERIRTLPGVDSVGIVNFLPLYGGVGAATFFTIEGRPEPAAGEAPTTHVRVADEGYFNTVGIRLLRGRNFSEVEAREARHVVVISEAMARQFFPSEDPLGKRINVAFFPKPNPTEIIGIVADVKDSSLTDVAEPTVYFSHAELAFPFMTIVIRTVGDPIAIAPAVQRELQVIDRDQPVSDVRTMEQVLGDSLSRARFNTILLGLFAGLAAVLAAIGIFGLMKYSVALQSREIGIRMALGAQQRTVLMFILKQGLLLTSIGIILGLAGALALTRIMAGLLFDVRPTDPLTFIAVAVLGMAVSLIACLIPARRATKVNPLIALRYE